LPERLKPSEWTERYVVLSAAESAEPGRYSFDRTPYLRGIIDAAIEPGVEEIVFLKPTQVGGSQSQRNLLGYWIDNDPGPCMFVMPSEQASEEMMRDRIRPLLENDRIRRHVSPHREDNTLSCVKLDTMPIFTAHAGSPQSLASKPCRYILPDEIDKYPPHSGREADPISLATERTQTFGHRKKIFKTSTPTTRNGAIWKAWEACGDKRRFHVPCPHCGHKQHFTFPQVKWPKLAIEDKVKRADEVEKHRLAYYECESCKGEIRDHHKPKMLLAGEWVSDGEKSKRVGFHLNSMYSPWCTFSGIAAEFIRAEGDMALTQNFRNSRMAEPFEDVVESQRPSVIADRIAGAPEPSTPDWCRMLILTADVQKDSLWYVVRAWDFGFRSQLVRYGECLNFDELYGIAFGSTPVHFVAIDGKYRTTEVVEFARRLPEQIALTNGVTFTTPPVICNDSIREGIRYLKIDTTLAKDRLAHMLADADVMRWRVHSKIGDDYCNQITAEHKVYDPKLKRFVWQPKYKGKANHLGDCESNQCAVATWLGMDQTPDNAAPKQDQPEPQPAHRDEQQGSWVTNYKRY
jgi:hypothetical protein